MLQVTVFGLGKVGTSLVSQLMNFSLQPLHIHISDPDPGVGGAWLDLCHALPAHKGVTLSLNEPGRISESDFIFHTAGKSSAAGTSRMTVRHDNIRLTDSLFFRTPLKSTARIICITNPVDVIAWHAWRYSGLPASQVCGIGTLLEQARLSFHLSEALNIPHESIEAWVLGEHGESQVPVFSQVKIGGKGWEIDPEIRGECADRTRTAASRIRETQPATRWAVAQVTYRLFTALAGGSPLRGPMSVQATPYWQEKLGVDDIFLGLPVSVTEKGIKVLEDFQLEPSEWEKLGQSARFISAHLFD